MSALYQQIRQMKRLAGLFVFLFPLALGLFFFSLPQSAHAETVFRRLNSKTVERGYTLSSSGVSIKIAVWPGTVHDAITLRLESLSPLSYPIPDGLTLASDVWVYDVLKAEAVEKDPIKLAKPLGLTLRYTSGTLYRKRIYYWDGNQTKWIPLSTKLDATNSLVFASARLPFAAVAVFEDQRAVEGAASWFRHRKGDTVASNDFPMGSTLRVTNLETNKSVLVVVRSNGPFVAGRVVDLASTAFEKIHPLWQGVTRVRAELVSR